jgi:putative transposase
MHAMRSYKYRLYPSKDQAEIMSKHLNLAKELWNEMLAFTKEIYKYHDKFPTRRALREFVKGTGLYSQAGQELVDRLLDGLYRKIDMKKKRMKGGFPRFKSIDRMKSLTYPQSGFSLKEKKLEATPFGEINIKKHREMQGKIKTLTLKREASGKWYAILTVETKPETTKNHGTQVGIDLGLINFAVLSDGITIKNPRHLRKYEDKLKKKQKDLSFRKKGGKNRKKAKLRLAVIHEKVRNTRRNFLHKLSRQLVNSHSLIALEDLQSQEMAGQQYGKSINDAGWGEFIGMLSYKAESAGSKIMLVNPENTTKRCSKCGNIQDMPPEIRVYDCSDCGMKMNRDFNAAINILASGLSAAKNAKLATGGTPGSNACGDVSQETSMKQDATGFSPW